MDFTESTVLAFQSHFGANGNIQSYLQQDDRERLVKKFQNEYDLGLNDSHADEIRAILARHGWQETEECFLDLFKLAAAVNHRESRNTVTNNNNNNNNSSNNNNNNNNNGKHRREESIRSVQSIFQQLSKSEVARVLDEYENNIDDAMPALLELVNKQEAAQEQMKMERQRISLESMHQRFPELDGAVIRRTLENNSWDLPAACKELSQTLAKSKVFTLAKNFPAADKKHIESLLVKNRWNVDAVAKILETAAYIDSIRESAAQASPKKTVTVVASPSSSASAVAAPAPLLAPASTAAADAAMVDAAVAAVAATPRPALVLTLSPESAASDPLSAAAAEDVLNQSMHNLRIVKGLVDTKVQIQQDRFTQHVARDLLITVNPNFILGPAAVVKPSGADPSSSSSAAPASSPAASSASPAPAPPAVSSQPTTAIAVSLGVASAIVDTGDKIVVEVRAADGSLANVPEGSSHDWIGMYKLAASGERPLNKNYVTYGYRKVGAATVEFAAPSEFGRYEFRYLRNNEAFAFSPVVQVGPQFSVDAGISGGKVAVRVRQASGHTYSRLWLALYECRQQDDSQYLKWNYAKPASGDSVDDPAAGVVSLDAPVKPGAYEVRLFASGYLRVAVSPCFTVSGNDKLLITFPDDQTTVPGAVPGVPRFLIHCDIVTVDPAAEGAWLGLYVVGENDHKLYKVFKWVTARNQVLTMRVPKIEGVYELRLFANRNYTVIAKSNSVVVPKRA